MYLVTGKPSVNAAADPEVNFYPSVNPIHKGTREDPCPFKPLVTDLTNMDPAIDSAASHYPAPTLLNCAHRDNHISPGT